MEDLSVDEVIQKLYRYKFARHTTLKKIAEEIGYNPTALSRMMGNKKQMSNLAKQRILYFLSKKEKENGEIY